MFLFQSSFESGSAESIYTLFVNCAIIAAESAACFCVHTTDSMRTSFSEGKVGEKCIVTEP